MHPLGFPDEEIEMPNHSQGNGRNVALPDESRPSWRPQDDQSRNRRNLSEEDDRYEDERYARHWEDRERRDWDRDERYGHGRYEGDRSFQSRSQGYPGSFEDRYRERDRIYGEDRSSGRGGSYYERGYNPERHGAQGGYGGGRGWEAERIGSSPRGYGYDDGDRERMQLGTGGGISGNYPQHGQRTTGGHRGKGPANYHRSDERIREVLCEVLTDDDRIDATHIEVSVKNGEVTLSGTVDDRQMKRLAEDRAEGVSGVKDVQNLIRIASK
jgi:osmotically-inducible protein OsmY